jgi:hypothetical protein
MNAVTVAWKSSEKKQPAGAKFIVPTTDAPNVNGARDVGFPVGQGNGHAADTSALRTAIASGRVKALYVVDPGPDGSIGDVSWITAARRDGSLPLLVVQGASQAIAPPGEAMEDWQILANLGRLLGLPLSYQSASDVRKAIANALPAAYADADKVPFTRPIPARNWLQASNPSERWKWDFLYQDLPPVKGHNVQMEGAAAFIPLKPVG